MKEGYWVIRTYISGSVGEKTKYWIPGPRPRRNRRNFESDIKKQQQNNAAAERQMARAMNANFKAGDILLGLDYSDDGLQKLIDRAGVTQRMDEGERMERIRQAAEHELRLCLRRAKHVLTKEKQSIQYIAITSDIDGKTGETVRVHHHLVINSGALDAFRAKWTLGGVDYKILSTQKDYTPIAHYFIKQVRKIPDAKKYMSSRNLVRPQPKDRIAVNNSELRIPTRCELLHRSEYQPNKPQYIRYYIHREGFHSRDKSIMKRTKGTEQNEILNCLTGGERNGL